VKIASRNYLIFLIMVLLALFETVSGFVLWLVLPRGGEGYMGGRGVATQDTFLWTRDTWLDLHNWVAVALVVIVVLHVVLHWKWIVRMTKSMGKREE
jgi:cytochrome b561